VKIPEKGHFMRRMRRTNFKHVDKYIILYNTALDIPQLDLLALYISLTGLYLLGLYIPKLYILELYIPEKTSSPGTSYF